MENTMANFVLPGYPGNIFTSAPGLARPLSDIGVRSIPPPSVHLQEVQHHHNLALKEEPGSSSVPSPAPEICDQQDPGNNVSVYTDSSTNKHGYIRSTIQVPAFMGSSVLRADPAQKPVLLAHTGCISAPKPYENLSSVPVSTIPAANLKQFAVVPSFDVKQYLHPVDRRPASALDNPITTSDIKPIISPSTSSLPVFPEMSVEKSTFAATNLSLSNFANSSTSTISGLTRPMSAGPAFSRTSADSMYPAPHLLYVSKSKALETLDAAFGEYFDSKPQPVLTSSPIPTGSLPTLATVAKMMEHTYKCTECEFSSDHKDKMDIHMCIHTGVKPFKCIVCNYTSNRRDKLVIHVRSHTGEKPFKCTICDYASVRKDKLVIHTRMHTGDKPYKCDQCDHACTRRDKLVIHKRTHNGEKPYRCYSCEFVCSRRDRLVKHMKIHQTVVTT